MIRALAILLLAAALATPSQAAAPKGATASRPSAGARKSAASARPSVRKAASDTAQVAPERAAARTLEDIHIEGEIPVPQVLFITAREQRRFMEFQHHRYIKSSRDVGAATVPPTRIVMSRAQDAAGKEPNR